MTGRLDGKVAVITGGASGIGRQIGRRFVAEGASVVLGDVNAVMLREAEEELGDACATQYGDVTIENDVQRLVFTATQSFGRLDIAVNNAGLAAFGPIVDLAEADWSRTVDICLKGVFLSTKHEARTMQAHGSGGSIINIASLNARQPAEGMSAYCAAKAAVEMFTRCSALELGPSGIRVNAIAPGLIDTPLTQYQRDVPALREAYLDNIPLGRVGSPDDVAGAALFLASGDSAWVSGDIIFVDGAAQTKRYPEMFKLMAEAEKPD